MEVNRKNGVGQTALALAAQNQHLNAVKILASAPRVSMDGALKAAAKEGSDEIFSVLVNSDHLDGDEVGDALTACGGNCSENRYQRLLAVPKVTLPSKALDNAIAMSADKGYKDVVTALLTRSSNFDADTQNRTLEISCQENQADIVRLLLSQGFDPNAPAHQDHETPLFSCLDCVDCVKALVDAGANVNWISHDSVNALITNAWRVGGNGPSGDVVQMLVKAGIEVNHQPKGGKTALIYAADEGNVALVKALLAVPGIDVNLTDDLGTTALHYAVQNGNLELIKELLAVPGIDVNVINTSGATPLTMARNNTIRGVLRAKGGKSAP